MTTLPRPPVNKVDLALSSVVLIAAEQALASVARADEVIE